MRYYHPARPPPTRKRLARRRHCHRHEIISTPEQGPVINTLEKISIFVDVQNVYYTCRQAHRANFDYNAFWAEVNRGRQLVKAVAYATDRGDAKQKEFQAILHAIGFTVKLKPVLKRRDGTTKADWDVGIALDVYEAAADCDTVILVSGDGDFGVLLDRIRQRFSTRSEVYGVQSLTSDQLTMYADHFHPIEGSLLLQRG